MLLLGGALLLIAAYDALSTTLSVGAAAGPLTARVGGWWWRFVHIAARRPTSPLMVSSGPVVVLITIGVWLALLWGGWTLVFAADPGAIVSSTTGEPAPGWTRLYYAGFTAFTLGVGDYVPAGQAWQVLTSVAVVSGLGLTTLAITYLVPVVSAVTARRVQANTIAGLGASPQDIVIAACRDGGFDFLDHRLPPLADSLLETAERHLSYPVLHYFHSAQRHVDLRTQAFVLDEAVTILQHGVTDDVAPHPAVLEGVRHAVSQLIQRATAEPVEGAAHAAPDLAPLRAAGIPTVDDATFTERVGELSEHRRRLASFAQESYWPLPEVGVDDRPR